MASSPDVWSGFYEAGLPLVGSPFFDAFAPSERVMTTVFGEEICAARWPLVALDLQRQPREP